MHLIKLLLHALIKTRQTDMNHMLFLPLMLYAMESF